MIKAVLFDLDGTLVDSLKDLADSVNFALEKNGFPTHSLDKFNYFVGDGMVKLIERALPQNTDNKTFQKVFNRYINHYKEHFTDSTLPYEGIIDLLNDLKNADIKLAVVSNKSHEMTLKVIDKYFSDTFDYVTGKKDGYPTKPDPKLTNMVMDSLGVRNSECVFIGDSGMDMAVAKNADCLGIGVSWGFRPTEELIENGADYIVNSPSQILDIIKDLNNEI